LKPGYGLAEKRRTALEGKWGHQAELLAFTAGELCQEGRKTAKLHFAEWTLPALVKTTWYHPTTAPSSLFSMYGAKPSNWGGNRSAPKIESGPTICDDSTLAQRTGVSPTLNHNLAYCLQTLLFPRASTQVGLWSAFYQEHNFRGGKVRSFGGLKSSSGQGVGIIKLLNSVGKNYWG